MAALPFAELVISDAFVAFDAFASWIAFFAFVASAACVACAALVVWVACSAWVSVAVAFAALVVVETYEAFGAIPSERVGFVAEALNLVGSSRGLVSPSHQRQN